MSKLLRFIRALRLVSGGLGIENSYGSTHLGALTIYLHRYFVRRFACDGAAMAEDWQDDQMRATREAIPEMVAVPRVPYQPVSSDIKSTYNYTSENQ
jgi:hypothetical protein